eukprot:Clim_evm93s11 gene=Clim_evmTU93s11
MSSFALPYLVQEGQSCAGNSDEFNNIDGSSICVPGVNDTNDDIVDGQEFDEGVREKTVLGTLYVILFLVSYLIVLQYNVFTERIQQRRRSSQATGEASISEYKRSQSREENAALRRVLHDRNRSTEYGWITGMIQRIIASYTLATSILLAVLQPMTIICYFILHNNQGSDYLNWLTFDLISGVWEAVLLSSNICMFALLPFAYLIREAEGIIIKGFWGYMLETIVVIAQIAALVLGITAVATWTIGLSWQSVPMVLQLLVSFAGIAMFAWCAPDGFRTLPSVTNRYSVEYEVAVDPAMLMMVPEDSKGEGRYEADEIEGEVKVVYSSRLQGKDFRKSYEYRKMRHNAQEATGLERMPAFRIPRTVHTMHVVFNYIAVTLFALHMLWGAVNPVIRQLDRYADEALKAAGLSQLVIWRFIPPIAVGLQVTMMVYILLATLYGFWRLDITQKMLKKHDERSFDRLLVVLSAFLLLTTSQPLLGRAVGIHALEQVILNQEHYGLSILENPIAKLVFNVTFIALLANGYGPGRRYIQLVARLLWRGLVLIAIKLYHLAKDMLESRRMRPEISTPEPTTPLELKELLDAPPQPSSVDRREASPNVRNSGSTSTGEPSPDNHLRISVRELEATRRNLRRSEGSHSPTRVSSATDAAILQHQAQSPDAVTQSDNHEQEVSADPAESSSTSVHTTSESDL